MIKKCAECGVRAELVQDPNGDLVCEDCLNALYTTCVRCGEMVLIDDSTIDPDGDPLCEDCLDIVCTRCSDCNNLIFLADSTEDPDGNIVCQECFDNNYYECDSCHTVIRNIDRLETPGGDWYCFECHAKHCDECSHCGRLEWNDDLETGIDGNPYCEDCMWNIHTECEECGRIVYTDDSYDGLCSRCAPEDYEDGGFSSCFFQGRNDYARMGSTRRFGVEIETDKCDDFYELAGRVPFDAKDDCSILGKEFASAILSSDAGLEAIENLCDFGKRHNWAVDGRCGLHIHLDASSEKTKQLKAIAAAYFLTSNIWHEMVDSSRHNNHYCYRSSTNLETIRDITRFTHFSARQNRYEWINFAAYSRHKTFEVRLHQGSIDAKEICNWIRIHAIFMDWASSKTFSQVKRQFLGKRPKTQFDFIARLCIEAGCEDLVEYYLGKMTCEWSKHSRYALACV